WASWPKIKAFIDGVTIQSLMDAARSGDIDQVRAVLRVRPELVNGTDPGKHGHTALHYAVLGLMPEMVRLLMQFGANPHSGIYPHDEATNPLAIVVERGYGEIEAIIRAEEKPREPPRPDTEEVVDGREMTLRQAVIQGDVDFLRKKHAEGEL